MLDSLFIRNFRCFEELHLESLKRVNLITGHNNGGKSSLLEALRLYASKAHPHTLDALLSGRTEYWDANSKQSRQPSGLDKQTLSHPLRYLFHQRRLPFPTHEDGIEIGPLHDPQRRLHLQIAFYQQIPQSWGLRPTRLDLQALPDSLDMATVEPALELVYGGQVRRLFALTRDVRTCLDDAMADPALAELWLREQLQAVYLPACGANVTQELASLWEQIQLTDLEDHVIDALALLDPKIKSIAFFGEANWRAPVVRYADSDQRLPLGHLGDGVMNILKIILALVNARDGLLLIDELENGLHWSVLPKVWKMLFKLTEQLNIQTFVTTHSQDCVRSFEQIWRQHEILGSCYDFRQTANHGVAAMPCLLPELAQAVRLDSAALL